MVSSGSNISFSNQCFDFDTNHFVNSEPNTEAQNQVTNFEGPSNIDSCLSLQQNAMPHDTPSKNRVHFRPVLEEICENFNFQNRECTSVTYEPLTNKPNRVTASINHADNSNFTNNNLRFEPMTSVLSHAVNTQFDVPTNSTEVDARNFSQSRPHELCAGMSHFQSEVHLQNSDPTLRGDSPCVGHQNRCVYDSYPNHLTSYQDISNGCYSGYSDSLNSNSCPNNGALPCYSYQPTTSYQDAGICHTTLHRETRNWHCPSNMINGHSFLNSEFSHSGTNRFYADRFADQMHHPHHSTKQNVPPVYASGCNDPFRDSNYGQQNANFGYYESLPHSGVDYLKSGTEGYSRHQQQNSAEMDHHSTCENYHRNGPTAPVLHFSRCDVSFSF